MCFCGDSEIQHERERLFEDPRVRKAFIRKVYFILLIQLLFTTGIVAIFVFSEDVQYFVRIHYWLIFLALSIMIVLMFVLVCCNSVRRSYPCNYICLGIFTLVMAFLIGCVAGSYAPQEVMVAVGITTAVCLVLTLFALQPWVDFTAWGAVILIILLIFSLFGIMVFFIPGREVRLVFACFGALVFSMMLVFDTQLILGGRHMYAISPDEHVYAALTLYLDVINIFVYILSIIGLTGGGN